MTKGVSGDSSLAILSYNAYNEILDYTLKLDGAEYISFETMGFYRAANNSLIQIVSGSHNISFSRCSFDGDWKNMGAWGSLRDISLEGSYVNVSLSLNQITNFVLNDNPPRLSEL